MLLFTGGGGAIPACIAGGIPACLAAGLQKGGGVVSQHALQVSRPTQGGSLGGSGQGGVSRSAPKGEVERDLVQAHSQGEVEGDLDRGGACSVGVPAPGGCLLWGGACLGGGVETPMTATAAGGTHPTGMHSCYQ